MWTYLNIEHPPCYLSMFWAFSGINSSSVRGTHRPEFCKVLEFDLSWAIPDPQKRHRNQKKNIKIWMVLKLQTLDFFHGWTRVKHGLNTGWENPRFQQETLGIHYIPRVYSKKHGLGTVKTRVEHGLLEVWNLAPCFSCLNLKKTQKNITNMSSDHQNFPIIWYILETLGEFENWKWKTPLWNIYRSWVYPRWFGIVPRQCSGIERLRLPRKYWNTSDMPENCQSSWQTSTHWRNVSFASGTSLGSTGAPCTVAFIVSKRSMRCRAKGMGYILGPRLAINTVWLVDSLYPTWSRIPQTVSNRYT